MSLTAVQSTLGSARRWAILRELANGSSLLVSELAERTGMTSSALSKQLSALVDARIVIHPRGRLYEIAPQVVTDKAERVIDFGHCLLRMNAGMEHTMMRCIGPFSFSDPPSDGLAGAKEPKRVLDMQLTQLCFVAL